MQYMHMYGTSSDLATRRHCTRHAHGTRPCTRLYSRGLQSCVIPEIHLSSEGPRGPRRCSMRVVVTVRIRPRPAHSSHYTQYPVHLSFSTTGDVVTDRTWRVSGPAIGAWGGRSARRPLCRLRSPHGASNLARRSSEPVPWRLKDDLPGWEEAPPMLNEALGVPAPPGA